jgi:hypothetical protein
MNERERNELVIFFQGASLSLFTEDEHGHVSAESGSVADALLRAFDLGAASGGNVYAAGAIAAGEKAASAAAVWAFMPLEDRARSFAAWAHRDQKRKYTGDPYIRHPEAVAALVRGVPHTEEMLAAAWLHDTVEDTEATPADIVRLFGSVVASLVEQLTDVSRPEDGNRKLRKAKDREHTGRSSPEAKTVKLADLIDNSRSIVAHDPDFAAVYLEEKRLLLEVLREGDASLWAAARAFVVDSGSRSEGAKSP